MDDATSAPRPGALKRLPRILQWIVFAVLALFALAVCTELRKVSVPGAPVTLLYGTIAAVVLLAISHLPPVLGRLPRKTRWVPYGAIIAVFILFGIYLQAMEPAWERTPQGAKEAAEFAANRERDAKEQRERDETAKVLADAQAVTKQLKDLQAKLEGCFTRFGHRLPAFEDPVKASLHNPAAFQHVETILIVPDDQRNNVEMRFRAENGFGAIRTATVRAQLIADDCTVQNIGNPTID